MMTIQNDDEFVLARLRMVENQIIARGIHDKRVIAAIGAVPRHLFIPTDELPWAYSDGPLPIGDGQTISQPYIVALMIEMLDLDPTHKVLEIGCGSGYQAAVLSELAGQVHTIEVIPALARHAEKTLFELGYTQVHVHVGDGSQGWAEASPYDRIIVAAAAPEVPQALLEQLSENGRLVAPVGGRGVQQLETWQRKRRKYFHQVGLGVCFVPLRGQFGWK
jgi:protein-L-isoaspartate(D-aspartate) O-methyltransferase